MKKLIVTVCVSLLLAVGSAKAAPYDNTNPIPVDEILLNFNTSGLDWVYAGPVATNGWALNEIYAPSYRAAEGWRFATAQEWANKPQWTDFIQPGHSPADASGSNHSTYKFASEYWSDGIFTWVDIGDAISGALTNGNGLYDPRDPVPYAHDLYEAAR